MALLVPKFSYDPGTGSVSFIPTYPPVEKPGPHDGNSDDLESQRVDSITLSGKKQTFYIRTDVFRNLTMNFVPQADLAAWNAFFKWAVTGGTFDYYPDSTVNSFTTYTLEDTSWNPKFAFNTFAKFSLKMRQFV